MKSFIEIKQRIKQLQKQKKEYLSIVDTANKSRKSKSDKRILNKLLEIVLNNTIEINHLNWILS